ncbi:MAG TPA: hypothetical protein PLV42_07210 [bacterium]|nr:hypothetical protein [bacterium]
MIDFLVVDPQELLARFVVRENKKRWLRADNSVKQDAFIPYPYPDLSLTRHVGISQAGIWELGDDVANASNRTLYGRADSLASEFQNVLLNVYPDPLPENPNHAVVVGWPLAKEDQKAIAQEIAATAHFVPKP